MGATGRLSGRNITVNTQRWCWTVKVDIINGYLGAGKTTLVRNLIDQLALREKTVVLVNEFGQVGIDGALLKQTGADVVELPNGCVCCTLNADLRAQIQTIARQFSPDRLLIEPTGVATINNLVRILGSLSLEQYITEIRNWVVVDAGNFLREFQQSRMFVQSQLVAAQIVVINKCDRVAESEISQIHNIISTVNGTALIIPTSYGRVNLPDIEDGWTGQAARDKQEADRCKSAADRGTVDSSGAAVHPYPGDECRHSGGIPQYQEFSRRLSGEFDREQLVAFFGELGKERYGRVVRAKGIFALPEQQWLRLDYVYGEYIISDLEKPGEESRVAIIGTELQRRELENALAGCNFFTGESGCQDE